MVRSLEKLLSDAMFRVVLRILRPRKNEVSRYLCPGLKTALVIREMH